MIVHKRIIQKEVYERLIKMRDEMYERLFDKYKNDPEMLRHEYKEGKFDYCQSAAWWEADKATIGREITAAEAAGRQHFKFGYQDCGCCNNMTVTLPQQNPNGDYEIIVEID